MLYRYMDKIFSNAYTFSNINIAIEKTNNSWHDIDFF